MKFTDLGSNDGIGANSFYIEIGPFRIVIDAGIHPKKLGLQSLPKFSLLEEHSLDFILVTHCHLDHIGALPVLFKKQQNAQILTSLPSATLLPRMLQNSCKIMLKQREEHGIKEYPFYTKCEVPPLTQAIVPMKFGATRTFQKEGQKLEVTFYAAGHVAGAAGVLLTYKHRNIFFTGDVLFEKQVTIPGASFPDLKVDTLVMETTRGCSERPKGQTRESEISRLLSSINHTLEHGGSCLIPVFALGRMQELLAIFDEARKNKTLCEAPIYCSGLGLDIMEYFDTISRKTKLINFRRKILKNLKVQKLRRNLYPGEDVESKGIYLVSSGMLVERTPSYSVAASLIDQPHNSIFFVGYCDPDTPGGKLLNSGHEQSFVFESLNYIGKIRANIEKFDLSGHADRGELVDFARACDPRSIVLSHGDKEAREWFEEEFAIELPGVKVLNPEPHETYSP